MQSPNQRIKIHKGNFRLRKDSFVCLFEGDIFFNWVPYKVVQFSGVVKWEFDACDTLNEMVGFELEIDNQIVGKCFLTSLIRNQTIEITGMTTGKVIVGDLSREVDKIVFSVLNVKEISTNSSAIKRLKNRHFFVKRLVLESDNYILALNPCYDYISRNQQLKEHGGFLIQYYGELKRNSGPLDLTHSEEILNKVNLFLSFINGSVTSVHFGQGIQGKKVIWTDYSSHLVTSFISANSWLPSVPGYDISPIWKCFNQFANKGKDDFQFAKSAIFWYCEANKRTTFLETRLIVAQAALELICNWWLIDTKEIQPGKASDNLRHLLIKLQLKKPIPEGFSNFRTWSSNNNYDDACHAITELRNALVHSTSQRRNILITAHSKVLSEALQLSIFYIEMSLLRIFNYNGTIHNRCVRGLYSNQNDTKVPWAV